MDTVGTLIQNLTLELKHLKSNFEALLANRISGGFDDSTALARLDGAMEERVFVYDWKIPMETLENYTLGEELYSKRFYIAPNSYRMFISMYPTGDASRPSDYMSFVNAFVGIARGVYDDYLLWPFVNKLQLILLDHTKEDPANIELAVDPRTTCTDNGEIGKAFQKPRSPFGEGCGSISFAQRSELLTRNYIEDEHITIRLKVFLD